MKKRQKQPSSNSCTEMSKTQFSLYKKISCINKIKIPSLVLLQVVAVTVWKVSEYGVFSGPNTEEYGPEKS